MPSATLVVISGHAGTGKSTLANQLGVLLDCPVVSRDAIREAMRGDEGDDLALRTLETFFATVRELIASGGTVIAEAAFQDHVWTPNLGPLAELADLRVVQCHAQLITAKRRIAGHVAEARVHDDAALLASIQRDDSYFTEFQRLRIDAPTLDVDTTDGYVPSIDEIVAFISGSES